MRTDDLDFELPEALIARHPAERRDGSRLMVVWRGAGRVEHRMFHELPGLLRAGDLLVRNRSAVVRARLIGKRVDSGGRVEGLFLRERERGVWEVMLRSNGKLREGVRVVVERGGERAEIELVERHADGWVVRVDGAGPAVGVLGRVGWVPLPPYILKARRDAGEAAEDSADPERYQTVYADPAQAASVAAPTAGLHFTPELDAALGERGVGQAGVVLHVGAGTFKPIEVDDPREHPMHAEWCEVPAGTLDAIGRARAGGGRVVAVGTTTCRALESVEADADGEGWSGWTRLMIAPGYAPALTDALLTNFHLPRSTLLLLVAALLPGGVEELLGLYEEAVARGYRFFSYGDAMLVLP